MKRTSMRLSSRITALLLCMAMIITSVWNENLVVKAAYDDDIVISETNLVPDAFAYVDGAFPNCGQFFSDQSTYSSVTVNEGEAGTGDEDLGEGKAGIKFVFNGATLGADYTNGIKYTGKYGDNTTLTNGKSYQISYKVLSTVDRKILSGFDAGQTRDQMNKTQLTADEIKTVSYTLTAGGEWSNYFFYLGTIDDENALGEHEVTVWDFSINEANVVPKDGTPVAETTGNLLTNGTFKDGNTDGWTVTALNASVTPVKYRVIFDFTGASADWQTWMTQNVTLDSGSKYKIQFDMESSVARTVTAGFDDGIGRLETKNVPANEKTTIEYEVTGSTGGKFAIYLGTDIGAHRVSISNVRITLMPVELIDTENDTYPAALTDLSSLSGYVPSDLSVLKNGSFRNGLTNWDTYAVDWMQQYNVVSYRKTTEGMQVSVGNTGDGEGNKAWDVQLNQNITLKKNLTYTLSFNVTSNKARSINVSIADIDNGETWVKPIGIQAGETREVVLNLPTLSEDAVNKLFSLQLGKVNDFGVTDNILLFEDMKIEVHGYQALAEKISDGYFDGDAIGTFIFDGNEKANVTVENSVKVDITTDCAAEDVTLTKADLDLLAGQTYRFSFVAGAMDEQSVTVNVKGSDSSVKKTETYGLTSNIAEYSFTYTPTANETVSLEFLLGGTTNTVCLDTIRCDINGYAAAAGIDTSAHDITALNKNPAPVISEANAAEAYVGQDIVLTYENNAEYTAAIDSVTVGATEVFGTSKCTIAAGAEKTTITLDKSLFTVDGESQIFVINVGAYWYEDVKVLQTVYKENKWQSSWLEEFDGTELDTGKWSYQNGTGVEYGVAGWGNNEQQYYTNENISVGDGELTIVAKKDNSKGTTYTSGRIWTMNDDQATAKFSQKYGRMEAKIKVPGGEGYEGIWPAFWMLPVDSSIYGGWPLSGEIDIMEIRGRLPDEADGTIHYGKDYPNNENSGGKYEFSTSEYNQDSDVNDYHVYAVEWEPGEIRWYVDGELYCTKNNWYSQSSKNPTAYAYPAPFDQEFYIILNLAVGGTFDGNLEPNAENLPAKMCVDYVRVYEAVDGYNENVTKPEAEKDTSVDINTVKSNIIDPKFENVTVVTNDSTPQDATGWNFVTLPTFGGAATLTTVEEGENTFAKINITNTGNAAHSVQLIQNLSLVKGYCYKLSFDAKADAARGVAVKFGDIGDSGWGTYATYEANLGTDLQHYEYSFQMLADTDLTSRVEFNWGTSGATAYIGNVTLEIVDSVTVDYDASKPALFDDNQIYNGAFNLGDASRLAYWHVSEGGDGKVESVTDSVYAFKATKGALYQKGIQLLQSDSYKLTFDTDADAAKKVTVTFKNADGSKVYKTETLNIAGGQNAQELTFAMDEDVTDFNAVVEFAFEDSTATVGISDIVLVKTSYNNVDWENLNAYPLTNGDFELGTNNWSQYGGAGFTVVEDAEDPTNHVAKVNGANGGNAWDNMLIYDGLELAGGYTYEFAFDVWADSEQEIVVTMEDTNYTAYFSQTKLPISTTKERHTYTFKLDTDQTLALKFQFGKGNGAYTAYIDNVTLNMKGAPEAPGTVAANKINYANRDLVLNIAGTQEWKSGISVYVGSQKLDASLITVAADTLTIDKSAFPKEGDYVITIKSTGYANAKVSVHMYPANGNLVSNGGFQNTEDPLKDWGNYIPGGAGSLSVVDGRLKVDYLYGYQDGGKYVPWSILFNQLNIPVENGKNYEISFLADFQMERPIMVSTDCGDGQKHQYLNIAEGEHTYSVRFTATGDGMELIFQVGTVGEDAEHYNPAAAFDPHTMYFDSISVREVADGETTVPVYTEDLTALIAEVEAMEQGNYTDASWANLQTVLATVKSAIADATTQPEVDRLKDNLQEALDKLETKADMTELTALIAEAEELTQSDYTEATWTVFADALTAAKNLVAETDTSDQSKVDNMIARLKAAIKQLEKKQSGKPEQGTEDGTDDGGDKKPGTDDGTDDGKDKKTGLWAEAIADQTYTGAAIQVLPAVYDGEDLLTLNRDYTLKYQNNKAAGVATVIITGKGNYKGKYEVKFNIVPKDITTEGETLYGVLKSGKTVTVKPTVTTEVNGKTKKLSAKDYTATYNYAKGDTYEEAKAYSVTITGKGNYTGSITYPTVFVTNKSMLMKNAKITLAYKSVDCDGTAKEPAVVVRAGGKEAAPESYSVAYTNNVYAGKATVTVTGDNKNLFGSKSVTFTIKGAALKKVAEMTGLAEGVDYTGKAQEPDFKVVLKADGKELTGGTDYEVTYKNNVKAGKATVIVEGKGAYEGKLTGTFRIHKVALGTEDVRSDATAVYTKAGAKATNVVVTSGGNVLVPGVDYKVSYKNNKKVGSATLTVTGMGGYSGKVTKDYTVVAADFAENVMVNAADAVTGTKYSKLKVTVTDNGKKLSKSEYSISYSVSGNDVSDGNAKVEKGQTITVTVTAKGGNYVEGSKAEDTLYVGAVNLSKAKVKVAPQVYTGEEVCPIPVEVKVGRDTLTLGEDYIITGYGNNINKSNKATITIQGIDDYCGSKTVTFKITERNVKENWNDLVKSFFSRFF